MASTPFATKQQLTQLLGDDDFFLWEYYGEGVLGSIQGWVFRSRVKVIRRVLGQMHLKPMTMLDVGCGPMFTNWPLIGHSSEYFGVDIMPTWRLKKYKNVMKKMGIAKIEVIRASAESLPFRDDFFDFVLSLDVLEHLNKPKEAIMEISRVANDRALAAISLPLENSFQKFSRLGFILMNVREITRISFLSRRRKKLTIQRSKYHCVGAPIHQTPKYHYGGAVKSYDDMLEILTNVSNLWSGNIHL